MNEQNAPKRGGDNLPPTLQLVTIRNAISAKAYE